MHILVTGGTGYIGSHTVVELLNSDHTVTIIDNLSNSKRSVLPRITRITGQKPAFIKADLLDREKLREIFLSRRFDLVIHFAALKAVGESVKNPILYHQNNVIGTINLIEAMNRSGIKNLVYSSSASVYGQPDKSMVTENSPLLPTNPYGSTKLICEQFLKDVSLSDPAWNMILLRYFNPVGAHPSGLIGEDPKGTPNNLMPYISRVAVGQLDQLQIFGNDYSTPDGTGMRDYIHVVDVALGHLKAIEKFGENPGFVIYNLGTGHGISVQEMLRAFETACGKKIPYRIVPRRAGDPAVYYADPTKAQKELHWKAGKTLADMCADTWRWQSLNPAGFP